MQLPAFSKGYKPDHFGSWFLKICVQLFNYDWAKAVLLLRAPNHQPEHVVQAKHIYLGQKERYL
jgi:hypothetical protein